MRGGEIECQEDLVLEVFLDLVIGARELTPILSAGAFPGCPVGGGLPLMPPIMPGLCPGIREQDILPTMEEG